MNNIVFLSFNVADCKVNFDKVGREPWSGGYGRRVMFQRSWVQIPALYAGLTLFTYICWKNAKMFV